jgi:hypothetical protein
MTTFRRRLAAFHPPMSARTFQIIAGCSFLLTGVVLWTANMIVSFPLFVLGASILTLIMSAGAAAIVYGPRVWAWVKGRR